MSTALSRVRCSWAARRTDERTAELAETPTRRKRLEPAYQERLINWGYAICDAALRKHVNPGLPTPEGFPYPGAGV